MIITCPVGWHYHYYTDRLMEVHQDGNCTKDYTYYGLFRKQKGGRL